MGPEWRELGPDLCFNMGRESETGVPALRAIVIWKWEVCA
jgi:hypothetical protein